MHFRKYRWSKDYEAAEEELELLLSNDAGHSERFELKEYETMQNSSHPDRRRLWCAEGSIIFTIEGRDISLQPGDAIDIWANANHEAIAGIAGCVYYEARP